VFGLWGVALYFSSPSDLLTRITPIRALWRAHQRNGGFVATRMERA